MNRRYFLHLATLAGCGVVSGCAFKRFGLSEKTDRPNILFVLIDDMGWKDIGCAGSSYYETPHIDKLASEGMRFLNAYSAAPVCTPTRGAIFSGKNPGRTQLTTVFNGPAGPDDRLHDKSKYRGERDQYLEARHRHLLSKAEVIIPQALGDGVIDIKGVCEVLKDANIESSTLEIVGSEDILKKSVDYLRQCGL